MKKKNIEIEKKSMTAKIPRWLLVLVLLNFMAITVLTILVFTNQKKTAFVDLGKLYEGFEMSKQMQTEFQSINFKYKNTLDSLALEIQSLEGALNIEYNKTLDEKIQQKKMNYYQVEENMQVKLEEIKTKGDEQIWQQINSYTQEYGKENGYDYIYGGNGSGSLMYANDAKDISSDVLKYINQKYLGE